MNFELKLIRRKLFAPIALWACMGVALLAFASGCGGSGAAAGGPGIKNSNKVLNGTDKGVAAGAISAQAMSAGMAVPFAILQAVSPNQNLLSHRKRGGGPTFVPGLNLYVTLGVAGKTLTMTYYTDAQAATPNVGVVTVTSNEAFGSTYTYNPMLIFNATGSINGGNIPLKITDTINIAFTDSSGTNTMLGGITLTKNNIVLRLGDDNNPLSLSGAGAIGPLGSITANYNYDYLGIVKVPVTVNLFNMSGTLTSPPITGTAWVTVHDPLANKDDIGIGTGTLDLPAGTFSLSGITDAIEGDLTGLLTTFNITTDQLSVKVGNLNSVFNNVSTLDLGTLLTTAPSTGSGKYSAPVVVQGAGQIVINQALGDGELVGNSISGGYATGYYWPSPTAAPVALQGPNHEAHTAANGIALARGAIVIVGSYQSATAGIQPCYWDAAVGTTAFTAFAASGTLQYGGEFEGISPTDSMFVGWSYNSGYVQQPIAYTTSTFYSLPTDGRSGNLKAIAVDKNNNILGAGDGYGAGYTPMPGVWLGVAVSGGKITTPFQSLPDLNGIGEGISAIHMSPNGVVTGGDGLRSIFWNLANGIEPNALALGTNAGGVGYGVNDAGTSAVGAIFLTSPATTGDLAVWPTLTGSPVDVTAALGTSVGNYSNLGGFFLLNDGSIIAIGQTSGSSSQPEFLYIKKS